jgi:epoxyqueuosine reductase QueG
MDPRVLWPGVRSIIMLGVNYGPAENPLALLAKRTRGAISAYAQGDDYPRRHQEAFEGAGAVAGGGVQVKK